MIPFKFFKGKVYTDEFTLPIARRMSGRTIAQDLSNLSNQVQQIVRSPEYIPAGYVSIPVQFNYDEFVISRIRTKMRRNINWRGYETSIQEREGAVIILKIVSGINIGGMFQILYLITRDGNTERYNVSVPLIRFTKKII
jgi:hypothetical protein